MELRESQCALSSVLEMGGRQDPSNLAAFLRHFYLYPEKHVEEGMTQHLTTEPGNQIVFWVHCLTDRYRIDSSRVTAAIRSVGGFLDF